MSEPLDITIEIAKFATSLGLEVHNQSVWQEALTHRSFLNENRNAACKHNERLEFLGDAVLELVTTEFLFHKYPERTEGELTSFRAALVRTESLASAAQKLQFGKFILMSKGEESTGGRVRQYILANTFEAVIGAIYLDHGLSSCRQFLEKYLLTEIDSIVEQRLDIDPKSRLQELAQEVIRSTPLYSVVSETGPDHNKVFEMQVMVDGWEFGRGSGHSKQEAEQQAAAFALNNWQQIYEKYKDSAKISPSNKQHN